MDIESSFRRLQDDAGWRLAHLEPRAHAMDAVQHRVSPARWWAIGIAATAMVVVAVLVVVGIVSWRGGATPPIAPPTSSSPAPQTPTPNPKPSETPAADADPSSNRVLPVFGGDCGAVLGGSDVSAAIDATVPDPVDASYWYPDQWAIELNGGMECLWEPDLPTNDYPGGADHWLHAWVIAANAFPDGGAKVGVECVEGDPEYGQPTTCDFTTTSYGYVLTGTFTRGAGSSNGEFAALSAAFARSALASGPAPAAWAPAAGDWSTSVDCAALIDSTDPASAMRAHGVTIHDLRDDVSANAPQILSVTAGVGSCDYWSDPESGHPRFGELRATIISGGAWMLDPSTDAPRVDVPGSDLAIKGAGFDEGAAFTIRATSGHNLLVVWGYYSEDGAADLAAYSSRLIAVLDAQR